nr:NADH dehydrogenase subunit 5 [Benthodytes sp. Gxx-2023]
MINLNYISLSLTLSIFLILIISSFFSSNSKGESKIRSIYNSLITVNVMKILSLLSIINLIIFFINPNNKINSLNVWIPFPLNNEFTLFLDFNFIFFSSTALIVTWSIVEFTLYYMGSDPFNNKFYRLLLVFLFNMLILTSANNMFIFFIGWEGVGFLSFLLISWWSTRVNANASALQAIIYNRIGDIGILILIVIIISSSNSWNMNEITNIYESLNENWKNILLFSCLLGAIGKSAQFGLHPWLPAAMEGPTPVSALLHSSTMVVAGVFILIRVSSLVDPTQLFLSSAIIIGALTSIFAATSAIAQHDIKKIIAYSTTSQLGLMVMAIGLSQPLIALFHICTHAFFKAMLFLCSGSIIHSYNNEQDLRKMNNISNNLPVTAACLLLGSLALMGVPFLSGFYSKDLILETITDSPTNFIGIILVFLATLLTAIYSFRIISFCFLNNSKSNSINPINEENQNLLNPLLRLAIGSIIVGWIMINYVVNSPLLIPYPFIKFLPLIVTIVGVLLAEALTLLNYSNNHINTFFSQTWYFPHITHSSILSNIEVLAINLSSRPLDRGWSENLGGGGLAISSQQMTQLQQIAQSGYIKQYLLSTVTIMTIIVIMSFTI